MEQIALFIVPAITAVTALILLAAGGKLLKSAIGLSAGLLGAGAGLMLAPTLSVAISPLIFAIIFGIISAIVAVYIAKFAIMLLLSISFACVLPVATWHIADLGDGKQVVEDVYVAAITPDGQSQPINQEQASLVLAQDAMTTAIEMLSSDVLRVLDIGKQRALDAWGAIPNGPRMMLVGSAIAGLLLGLLVATFMPFYSAAIVTSVGGSILLVEAVRNFITLIWSQNSMAELTPIVLVVTVTSIAIAGFGLQLTLATKRTKSKELRVEK
jgi:hypothetical protein